MDDIIVKMLRLSFAPFMISVRLIERMGRKKAFLVPIFYGFVLSGCFWLMFGVVYAGFHILGIEYTTIDAVYNISIFLCIIGILVSIMATTSSDRVWRVTALLVVLSTISPNKEFLLTSTVGHFTVNLGTLIMICLMFWHIVMTTTVLLNYKMFSNVYQSFYAKFSNCEDTSIDEQEKEEQI